MAERIISPGVFTRENDLSFLPQGIGEIGAVFIGPFKEGPAFIPTIVRSQNEFEEVFGVPDGSYYTGYAVQNYLREAGTVTIVRVAGINGYQQELPFGVEYVSGSTRKLLGTFFANTFGSQTPGYDTGSITFNHIVSSSNFTISGSAIGVSLTASTAPDSFSDIADVFGVSPVATVAGSKPIYVYNYFRNEAYSLENELEAGDGQLRLVKLPTQDFSYDATKASTPYVQSQVFSGERYNLFRIHTRGDGAAYNSKFKVAISNVKAATTGSNATPATFNVTVRGFNDTDRRKVILETFQNVTMDADSPNYIARVIGDRYITIDNLGKITENGNYANRSQYIYVECVDPSGYPATAAPFGHAAYSNPVYTDVPTSVPPVVYSTGSISNGSSENRYYSGFDFETGLGFVSQQNSNYLVPLTETTQTGSNTAFNFANSPFNYVLTGSAQADMNRRQFVMAFQGGFDGANPTVPINLGANITNSNTQGLNLATSTSSGSVAYDKAIAAISNPDEWDLNLIVAPGVIRELHPYVFDKLVDLCEDRQDCFFVGDLTSANAVISTAVDQAAAVDSSYVGSYYPWVKTIDRNTNKLISVPPSVLLPAVYASNDRVSAEWFAPAGLNRGGLVGAVQVLNRLTQAERDVLYEGKVNPIAVFPGQGICVWGQKTLQERASALDRINVRRLLITVKKFFASTARYLLFDQNTSVTRNRFLNTVNPYLEAVQQRQGLYAFRVVMDETNNTPDVIDRNELRGAIYLQPAKAAEFIILDFNILPTGASFGD
jgi:hypothetical protein